MVALAANFVIGADAIFVGRHHRPAWGIPLSCLVLAAATACAYVRRNRPSPLDNDRRLLGAMWAVIAVCIVVGLVIMRTLVTHA